MTRSTARDVERRLKDTPAGEPPADLLARLHAEIPPRLELAAPPPRRRSDRLRRRLPPPWLRAAAVIVLALGGAWMLWRLSVPVLAPQAAVEEAPGAAETASPAFEPGDARGTADETFAGEERRADGEPDASGPRESAAGRGDSDERESTSGSVPAERRDEPEAERSQALVEDLAAARAGTPVVDEPAELAEEVAVVGQASKAEGSSASTEVAGAGRSPLPSPPAAPAVAAPPSRVEADDPAPLAAESPVRSFVDKRDDRRSTLALHAGTGSWDLVRASLRRGELPPAAAVRIEEVVDALDDGGPPPEQGESFRVTTEGTPSPFAPGPGYRLLRFRLRARTTGAAGPVAEEARVQVDFDPRVVASWRLLGYENRDLEDHRFRHDDTVDAGEIGAGHAVTALYEVRLAGTPPAGRALAHLKLRYRVPGSDRFSEIDRTLRVADLSPTWDEAPPSLRLAAVGAELAEQLRGSRWTQGTDLAEVAAQAAAVAAERPGDPRAAELADLAARAARLARRR